MSLPFDAMHAALRAQVDRDILPGVSTALLRGREVVDVFCHGMADREARVPLREDHLFRIFSNSKLVTSCAVMQLIEEGRIALDDPIAAYIPELGERQVLRPGAMRLDDTEPAREPITVRHLMTHTSGLSYGIFDPGSLLYEAYGRAKVMSPHMELAALTQVLAPLPLAFHPGTRWEYSVGTDVLSRLVEVVSGRTFGQYLSARIFEPLEMADTAFWVPESRRERLCALYASPDPTDANGAGLVRVDDRPYPGAYVHTPVRESGGGGLVSSLWDMVRLLRSLIPGGATLLRPETIDAMWANQLPPGVHVHIAGTPRTDSRGFGLGSSIALRPAPGEPAQVAGEVSWGGLAGTVWWLHPRLGTAGVLMTQRWLGTGHPYAVEFKRQAYRALGQ
ncbi:serine hydrolase domain-containing protein [Ramlibacter sp. AN1015]|uniref:serine hydrolase domain-containing protein n=1 Tax=Ramlibacter sp. AN1015 TaxID=3133428 RepID=UPI0030C09F1E